MSESSEVPILGISSQETARILCVADELYVARRVSAGVIPKAVKHALLALDRSDVERSHSSATGRVVREVQAGTAAEPEDPPEITREVAAELIAS